ncbi:hypothetical protein [Aestuariimicrobium ganziense]|uniref:hypothetical protein n=1 Tax=Aestuariimicrobium ganziense TaxID=2773677 RepID=UPI001940C955|nr:hypothetical protein [Aestuariimicrobium ganziense]
MNTWRQRLLNIGQAASERPEWKATAHVATRALSEFRSTVGVRVVVRLGVAEGVGVGVDALGLGLLTRTLGVGVGVGVALVGVGVALEGAVLDGALVEAVVTGAGALVGGGAGWSLEHETSSAAAEIVATAAVARVRRE